MCLRIFRHVHFWKILIPQTQHISYTQYDISASIVISLGHSRFYRSAYVMLRPSYPRLKKVVQEAVLHVPVQLHSAMLQTAADENGKSSVTANKFLKVVADAWMN